MSDFVKQPGRGLCLECYKAAVEVGALGGDVVAAQVLYALFRGALFSAICIIRIYSVHGALRAAFGP